MPNMGLERATIAVDEAAARLQTELPVKVKPHIIASSPRASVKRRTK